MLQVSECLSVYKGEKRTKGPFSGLSKLMGSGKDKQETHEMQKM